MDISVVVPVYNEEESLPELTEWISRVCIGAGLNYEILYIDDGSTDGSWDIIKKLKESNDNITGISFRRNYGKAAALHTGFREAGGNVVVTMDADMQDSPGEIPALYKMVVDEGYDLVSGWKKKRHDPFVKRFTSRIYNFTARRASGIKLHDFNCGLKAYRRDVTKSIEVFGEMHRYIPMLAAQSGFDRIGEKVVEHRARKYGVTKYGLDRFIKGYLDLLTITFITRFSKRPMHLFGALGSLLFLAGFILAVSLGLQKLHYLKMGQHAPLVANSPYFYIALTVMIMGTFFFLTGFLAELVNRSSSNRNEYHIKDKA